MAISTKSLYEAFKPREEEVLEDIIRIARLDSNSKEPLNIRKCGEELRKMAEEYLHVSAIEEFPSHYDEAKHMYFEVGNVDALAQKIAALVSSQRIDYSAWLKNYDWQVIARKTASVYHSLANKKG